MHRHIPTDEEKSRGASYDLKYGFMPFSGKGQLRNVFNGEEDEVSNALRELQFTSVALSVDTMNSNSFYVELITFTPSVSIGRFSFGSQLTQADVAEDSAGSAASYQSIATQKLMNGGGNVNLNFNRPILYLPFTDANRNYLLMNTSLTLYADINRMNSIIYNPGLGTQLNLDFDLRLLSNKSYVMIGNLYRFGIRGRMLYNAFDAKYRRKNDIDADLNNLLIFAVSGYLGLGPIFVEIGYNISNKSIVDGTQNLLRVSLQPVRY